MREQDLLAKRFIGSSQDHRKIIKSHRMIGLLDVLTSMRSRHTSDWLAQTGNRTYIHLM
jgi:hypothetical protein